MVNGRIKVIACATIIEEMMPLMPPEYDYEALDFGLHRVPEKLKIALQETINSACSGYDFVLLGYGLCSMAVVGLQANGCTLVIPRVDDCIACFLGSQEAYSQQAKKEPGTYYLTKGWIEVNDTLLDERERVQEKYGVERGNRVMEIMLKHYKRLVYIDTGLPDQGKYRQYAQKTAAAFNLRFEEIPGSNNLIKKMLVGSWDEDFVVAPPGQTVKYIDFLTTATKSNNQV